MTERTADSGSRIAEFAGEDRSIIAKIAKVVAAAEAEPEKYGDLVEETVGPPLATVPDVLGDALSEATQVLNTAGLAVGQQSNVRDCGNVNGVSIESPHAGTVVPQGSAVNLSIGQKPPTPFSCQ